eukprot:6895407-Prymnesium_polylepis.1
MLYVTCHVTGSYVVPGMGAGEGTHMLHIVRHCSAAPDPTGREDGGHPTHRKILHAISHGEHLPSQALQNLGTELIGGRLNGVNGCLPSDIEGHKGCRGHTNEKDSRKRDAARGCECQHAIIETPAARQILFLICHRITPHRFQ